MEAWTEAVIAPAGPRLWRVPASVRLVAAACLGRGAGGGDVGRGGAGGWGGAGGSPGRDGSAGDGGGWWVSPTGPGSSGLLLVSQPLEVTVPRHLLSHGHVGRLPVGGLQLVLDHHLLSQVVV